MPHITLNSGDPGVRGLFRYRPETAVPLNELVDVLLRGESTLTCGERELIAAYVSSLNRCRFCYSTHAAMAAAMLPEGMALVEEVLDDLEGAAVPDKVKTLLRIAEAVTIGGKEVTEKHIAAAREAGASDMEIHDTVLIAAVFCMFNRYVDGLDTIASDDPAHYAERAKLTGGYVAVLSDALRQPV